MNLTRKDETFKSQLSYDLQAMLVFLAVLLVRFFCACETCKKMRSRIAVALFAMPNPNRRNAAATNYSQARMVREFGQQLCQSAIRIIVLDGVLELDNRLFKAVCNLYGPKLYVKSVDQFAHEQMLSITVTYMLILIQFQLDEGVFFVIENLY